MTEPLPRSAERKRSSVGEMRTQDLSELLMTWINDPG